MALLYHIFAHVEGGFLKYFLFFRLSVTVSFGQVMDVTDIYRSGTCFFPNFEQLGENSKLPHFRISSLIEGHEGYVWIGTKDGGLIRYDGYTFHSYEDRDS